MSVTIPDLLTCEPSDLAQYLLSERFNHSSKETATFLLQATSCLPNAEELSAELIQEGEDDDEDGDDELHTLGNPLAEEIEISMIAPRGRLKCSLFNGGIYCVNAKDESFQIRPDQARQLIVFPKPEDIRKKGARDMVLLTIKQEEEEEVMFKNKMLPQLCFQLPIDSSFLEHFRTALNLTDIARVGGGAGKEAVGWKFSSHTDGNTSTTTGGMPFVRCYRGVQDGHLFPLREGLLFVKPPLFVPRSELHSIACGRGAGQSRYIDVTIALHDGDESLEFTNIHRDEQGVLNDYIHRVLIPAMQKDASKEDDDDDDDEENVVVLDTSDATEDDDDDNDDEIESSRRPKRKASKEARAATKSQMENGEDEDDEDDHEEDDDNWVSVKRMKHDDDDNDDDEESVVVVDVIGEEETEDDDDDSNPEKSRRPKRKASKEAREASSAQLRAGEDDNDEEDEEDDNWVSTSRRVDDSSDDELNEDDDDDDEEQHDDDSDEQEDDKQDVQKEEEVFFEESV